MNYQEQYPALKKHRAMTICAELACVCLLFASLLFGMQQNQLKHQPQDTLDAGDKLTQETIRNPLLQGGASYNEVMTGGYIINGGSFSGSYIEITTDENGNSIVGSINGGTDKPGYVIIQPGQNTEGIFNPGDSNFSGIFVDQSGNVITAPNYNTSTDPHSDNGNICSPRRNLASLLFSFLPCVLFLMYLWKLYEYPRGKMLLPLIFLLALPAYSIANLAATASKTGISLLILQGAPVLISSIAFVILSIQIPRKRASKTLTLVAFICHFLFILTSILAPILFGMGTSDLPLFIIGELLSTTAVISLTIGLFLFAYRNGREQPDDKPEEPQAPTV